MMKLRIILIVIMVGIVFVVQYGFVYVMGFVDSKYGITAGELNNFCGSLCL